MKQDKFNGLLNKIIESKKDKILKRHMIGKFYWYRSGDDSCINGFDIDISFDGIVTASLTVAYDYDRKAMTCASYKVLAQSTYRLTQKQLQKLLSVLD